MTHHPGYPPPPGAPAGQPAPPGSHAAPPGTHAVPPGAHPAGTATNSARIVIGLLLVVPAAIALLLGYAIPTGWTFITSFQDRPPLAGTESRFVGVENYRQVAGEFPGSVGLAVLTIAVPLLGLLVVAPLLAWLAHRAGTAGRRIARLALTLPVVLFAPAGAALGWYLDRFDPDSAVISLLAAVWLSTFGLVCGIGVTLFLAALRQAEPVTPAGAAPAALPGGPVPAGPMPGSPPPRIPAPGVRATRWPAVLTLAGLATIAVLAVGLQGFTYAYLPGDPESVMIRLLRNGFQLLVSGRAAADASLLLIVLMLLGIAAWLLVVLTGLRIELEPAHSGHAPTRPGRVGALVATCLGALAVLAITGYGLWPVLSRLGSTGPQGTPRAGEALVNTWVPTLVSTLIGVGLAAVAAFGIGWLRPLGRWSELLLPFAPWLFVAVGPLVLAKFEGYAVEMTRLFGPSAVTLVPPVWLVIPALFILTVLFRGLAYQRPVGAGGSGRAVVRALPMVALLAGATWLVQAESLLWPLVAGHERVTAVTLAYQTAAQYGAAAVGFALLLPIPVILVFAVALGALQLRYLDRLAIRVGRAGESPRA